MTYPAFAAALKRVFLDVAGEELRRQGMAVTDSAITLLSGVHRRDVRNLTRGDAAGAARATIQASSGIAGEVVARWMSDRAFCDARGQSRALVRGSAVDGGSFDALVAAVSSDVRPRAVFDELKRLGVVREGRGKDSAGIRLVGRGFAPRRGFDALAGLFATNLHDHAAAAVANLSGESNYLEQAVYVDQIGDTSVARLQAAAQTAWQQAFNTVMAEAQYSFDADATLPAPERRQRARFGVYFYNEQSDQED